MPPKKAKGNKNKSPIQNIETTDSSVHTETENIIERNADETMPNLTVVPDPTQMESNYPDGDIYQSTSDEFDLAVSLVVDARLSRLEIYYKRDPRSVKLYNLYYNNALTLIYYVFMVINLLSILIEEPAAIQFKGKDIPYYIPLSINIVCEAIFYCRWLHILIVADLKKMSDSKSFFSSLLILVTMSVDDITYVIQNEIGISNPLRWSRWLRPVLLLTFPENKRIRAAFDNIRCTAVDIISVFGMFIASLLFISIITLKTMKTDNITYPDGSNYFPNFIEITWDLYVLSTTANSPDVILPAYERNVFYFSIYIWVCTASNWLFMGILTASVYNAYKSHLGAHLIQSVLRRKNLLDEAFGLLVGREKDNSLKELNRSTFIRLMAEVDPKRSPAVVNLIFSILDGNGNDKIAMSEFARLTEYLQLNFREVVIGRQHFSRFIPKFYSIYTSSWFQSFVRIIRLTPVRIFFDIMVICNGITLVVAHNTIYEAYFEAAFTGIFSVEIVLKYLASGGVRFFTYSWNIFDMVVVGGAFVGQLMYAILSHYKIDTPGSISQIFLLLRLFRLLKLIGQINIFKCIVNCIIIILPSLLAYAAILLILFYIFACFGMEIFGGLFHAPHNFTYLGENPCKNAKLIKTDFMNLHYCCFNFNNAANSFVMLFILSVGNNWHVMTAGFAAVTGKPCRIFFLFIHWLCVLLVLNIVLAFIIEAFLIEYDPRSSNFEQFIVNGLKENKVDAEIELQKRGLQDYIQREFFITKETLDKLFPPDQKDEPFTTFFFIPDGASIELLMFRMFEDEIEEIAANYTGRTSIRAHIVKL